MKILCYPSRTKQRRLRLFVLLILVLEHAVQALQEHCANGLILCVILNGAEHLFAVDHLTLQYHEFAVVLQHLFLLLIVRHQCAVRGIAVIQFIQQQLAQVGIKAQVQALEAGQRVEKVESHQDAATAPVRLYYTGWSSSTGEADWGLRPLFAGDKTPPSMYNISYYKNPTVDADIMKALGTTDRAEKTKLYTEVQEEIWKDAPWAFLVTEKLLYATSKKLTGMYVMPDANYFFEEIDLQ